MQDEKRSLFVRFGSCVSHEAHRLRESARSFIRRCERYSAAVTALATVALFAATAGLVCITVVNIMVAQGQRKVMQDQLSEMHQQRLLKSREIQLKYRPEVIIDTLGTETSHDVVTTFVRIRNTGGGLAEHIQGGLFLYCCETFAELAANPHDVDMVSGIFEVDRLASDQWYQVLLLNIERGITRRCGKRVKAV